MRCSTRLAGICAALLCAAASASELRFCLRADPKTFDPLMVEDAPSEVVRDLTAGFLVRINRSTQKLEPGLATEWRVLEGGRRIDFALRGGLKFSDGTPCTAADVVATVKHMMDPAVASPVGDAFRTAPGEVEARALSPVAVMIRFPAPVSALAAKFDQVGIVPVGSANKQASLGPFFVAVHTPGAQLVLKRNPYYWRTGSDGRRLPYYDEIRIDIQQNREIEALRLTRGQIDLLSDVDPASFERLKTDAPGADFRDSGPSLDSELIWFNQTSSAPIPDYKKQWFRSAAFRRAISDAIDRDDICRIAYHGHASPAAGPVSPANRFWVNATLKPPACDPAGALRRLQSDGFRLSGGRLYDRNGHQVEFSLVTNAGSKLHEKTMALIQQDLQRIGVQLNVLTLEFPALIERITRTFNYESCLLGFANTGLDPGDQMNIWLSSARNHQWNPSQKNPETPWEAEIDRLMREQSASLDDGVRKRAFDRVQEIAAAQAPFIFLVHPNVLSGASRSVRHVVPAILTPHLFWNADELTAAQTVARNGK